MPADVGTQDLNTMRAAARGAGAGQEQGTDRRGALQWQARMRVGRGRFSGRAEAGQSRVAALPCLAANADSGVSVTSILFT